MVKVSRLGSSSNFCAWKGFPQSTKCYSPPPHAAMRGWVDGECKGCSGKLATMQGLQWEIGNNAPPSVCRNPQWDPGINF